MKPGSEKSGGVWHATFLVFSDLIALTACCYSAYWNISTCCTLVCYIFGGTCWFVLSGLGSVAGVLDIVLNSWSANVSNQQRKNAYLQLHYFLEWVALIVGYPMFVTGTWLTYFPSFTVGLHLLCVLIPLLIWALKATPMIPITTELCLGMCLVSHFYVAAAAGNAWSLIGAFVMAINLFFLCFSAQNGFWGIHSREAFTITSAIAYCILSKSVQAMIRYHTISNTHSCKQG